MEAISVTSTIISDLKVNIDTFGLFVNWMEYNS